MNIPEAAAIAAALLITAAAHAQAWHQIGPEPIDGARYTALPNATLSGMIDAIAIDPSGRTDATIYAGSTAGGVWKTTNGGQSWTSKSTGMSNLFIGAVALDPSNPSIVYAGIGGPYGCCNGSGLYRSTDGANHWTLLQPNAFPSNANINQIVLPASGTLLVGTTAGLFKSVDGGKHFGDNSPKFNNGNPIPISVPHKSLSTGNISDLRLDTRSPKTVYVAIDNQGVYKSTDAGTTFPASGKLFSSASFPPALTAVPPKLSSDVFIRIAQSTQPDNQTFYAFLCQGTFGSSELCVVLKSTNGGSGFNSLQTNLKVNQQDYDQLIGVDPQNANGVYVGLRQLYYSNDGGATGFNQIDGSPGTDLVHTDVHTIVFSPPSHYNANPTRAFIGSDGGFVTTAAQATTPGSQWQFFNQGFATALVYSLDIGRGAGAGYSYVGLQDNGTVTKTPSEPNTLWQYQCCGDSSSVAVDPLSPIHAITLDDGCLRSTTNAKDWATCNATPASGNEALGLVSYDPSGNVAYATSDPLSNQPQSFQIFQSKDNADTFPLMHTFSQLITVIAQVKNHPNTLWLGMNDGSLRTTANALQGAGATWKKITIPGKPSGQSVSAIDIDPGDASTIVVVYPGLSGLAAPPYKHVFRSSHNGSSWKDISGSGSGNLPDVPLYAVKILPNTTPHTIIVASDYGVLQSADTGKTWQVLGTGLPPVKVTSLALDYSAAPSTAFTLRAATFGRSVFQLEGSCPLCPPAPTCDHMTGCVGPATWTYSLTCHGLNVGIVYNGGCHDLSGEYQNCYAGFTGASTAQASWGGGIGPPTWYEPGAQGSPTVCTENNAGESNCKVVTFKNLPSCGVPTGGNNPPPQCGEGEKLCAKFSPPRCVPASECTIVKNTP